MDNSLNTNQNMLIQPEFSTMQVVNLPKAGFLIRSVAYFVDHLILATPTLLFFSVSNLGNKGIKELLITFGWYLVIFFIFSNIYQVLYFSLTTYYFGGTIGKLIAGMAVVDEQGENLTFWRSFFRHVIGYMVSGLLFGLGFFAIIKNKQKQGWHDQLTGSYVVMKRKTSIFIFITLILLLSLNIFLAASNISKLIDNQTLRDDINYLKVLSEESLTRENKSGDLELNKGNNYLKNLNYPNSGSIYQEL